jgi:hypothetical protein
MGFCMIPDADFGSCRGPRSSVISCGRATDIRIGKMLAHLWGSAGPGTFPASKIERMLSVLWRAWTSHVVQAQSDAVVLVAPRLKICLALLGRFVNHFIKRTRHVVPATGDDIGI